MLNGFSKALLHSWQFHICGLIAFPVAAGLSFPRYGRRLVLPSLGATLLLESVVVATLNALASTIIGHPFWKDVIVTGSIVIVPLLVAATPFAAPRVAVSFPWLRVSIGIALGVGAIPFGEIAGLVTACSLFGDCP
jgi:hypothetical protein